MAIYRFLDFTFCTTTFALTKSGKEKSIRPKTAQALTFFITHPNQLISKKALFLALWQSEDVQDYRLFQVISELRKLSPKQTLIRTLPNQGYIWHAPVIQAKHDKKHFTKWPAIAASVSLIVSIMSATMWFSQRDTPTTSRLLPAMSGYSNALLAFQQGDLGATEKWLTFSLKENPQSLEAQLLLAEVKLHQDKFDQASQLALSVINQTPAKRYYRTLALDLLSRISLENSAIENALNYALESKKLLNSSVAECSSQIVNQRISAIVTNYWTPNPTLKHDSVTVNTLIETRLATAKPQANSEQNKQHLALCQQLNHPTSLNYKHTPLDSNIFDYYAMIMRA